MTEKIFGMLGLMRRASAIVPGEDKAAEAVRAGKGKLLLLAEDVADNARRKAENFSAGRSVALVPLPFDRAALGDALGLGSCSVAAVTDLGFANALMKELAARDPEKYRSIAQETERRCEKAARRKKETAARRASKRNEKRRTEAGA